MAENTKIEWTDATWNIITGCTLVDEGCRHCYAARLAATRLQHIPSRKGLARLNAGGEAKFTGEVRFNDQWLNQPLRWKRPRRIFVCAHGDLFHDSVPDDWIICGGESGPNARPMHPDWARSLRDQCTSAGVAFLFKQWGEWSDGAHLGDDVDGCAFGCFDDAGQWVHPVDQKFASAGRHTMFRIGKARAGRLLDGREWNELPGVGQ